MTRFFVLLMAVVGLLVAHVASAEMPAGPQHVRAKLVADVSAIRGDRPFKVGVLLEIDPGWHIYWKNPGDSGSPTRLSLHLPTGFSSGPVQYPVPQRMAMPGDVVNFGYENQAMLVATITPAPQLMQEKPQTLSMSAEVRYLVCSEEVCLPGSAKLAITLPTTSAATGGPIADPAGADLLSQWAKQMPESTDPNDVSGLTCDVQLAESGNKARATLRLQWSVAVPSGIAFFPGPVEGFDVSDAKVATTGLTTTCSYVLASPQNALLPPTLETVVAFVPEGRPRVGLLVPIPTINRQAMPPAVPPASP